VTERDASRKPQPNEPDRHLDRELGPAEVGPAVDPALAAIAHPTEPERVRRGTLLGVGFGVLLLALARRRRSSR
jgi:hypothetical protein